MKSKKEYIEFFNHDELNLLCLLKLLWLYRVDYYVYLITGIVLGFLFAITSPKNYKSSTTLILETSLNEGSEVVGFAALANMNSNDPTKINSELYEKIALSRPFLYSLLNKKFYLENNIKPVMLIDYMNHYRKNSLLKKVITYPFKLFKNKAYAKVDPNLRFPNSSSNINYIDKSTLQLINDLRGLIAIEIDQELSVISIDVTMQDPYLAAQVVEIVIDYITEFVTNYSISKIEGQLEYLDRQYFEQKLKYEKAQMKLADFIDRNKNIAKAKVQSEMELLKSEFDLNFLIYSQIAQQRENVRLKIKENTPVFTVLDPIYIPTKKDSPSYLIIVIIMVFLCLSIATIFILIKNFKRKPTNEV